MNRGDPDRAGVLGPLQEVRSTWLELLLVVVPVIAEGDGIGPIEAFHMADDLGNDPP